MADADVAAKAMVHNGEGSQHHCYCCGKWKSCHYAQHVSEIELVWYAMAGVGATATRYDLAAVAPSKAKLSSHSLWQWLFSLHHGSNFISIGGHIGIKHYLRCGISVKNVLEIA